MKICEVIGASPSTNAMKKLIVPFLFILVLAACNQKSKVEKAVEEIPVDVKIIRFDKLFFETKPQDLSKLKLQFPYLFPANNPDTVWTNKMQNPQWRELYAEVETKYPDNSVLEPQIAEMLRHIKYYFPESKTPKIFTVIAEMDINSKGIYADSLVFIPLELYLGKDHKFYKNEFPDYIKQSFEADQIVPDLISSFGVRKIAFPADKSLLSLMVFAGKELYLKDKLLPNATDEIKMGYTKAQIDWCVANESYIWSYFIEKNLLYSNDSKLAGRFIAPAPFTKFYLEIDNESPGRVGAWMGWQIIKSYMENNETNLKDMLKMDAKIIFENSKYKPKK
jgi:gliding motility-associated lipoprotein GldB